MKKQSETQEKELSHLLQTDSEKAIAQLHQYYYDKLLACAFKITHCPQHARDITQDIFLKVWENRYSLSHVQLLGPYLFKSCRNACLTQLARMDCEQRAIAHLTVEYQSSSPDDEAIEREENQRKLLYRAVRQLPPRRRQIFFHCKMEGKTRQQVAAQFGVSLGTVNDHLAKATKAIRKFIYLCGSFQET